MDITNSTCDYCDMIGPTVENTPFGRLCVRCQMFTGAAQRIIERTGAEHITANYCYHSISLFQIGMQWYLRIESLWPVDAKPHTIAGRKRKPVRLMKLAAWLIRRYWNQMLRTPDGWLLMRGGQDQIIRRLTLRIQAQQAEMDAIKSDAEKLLIVIDTLGALAQLDSSG